MTDRILPAVVVAAIIFTLDGCRPAQHQVSNPEVMTQLPRTARPLHYSISVVPDAANLRFAGEVVIDLEVLQQTDNLTLNAAELAFQSVALTDRANKSFQGQASLDADKQTATLKLPSNLTSGPSP